MDDSEPTERLVAGYAGRLFVTVSFGWLLIQLGRQVIPPLLPNIIADLAITPTAAGFALTLMWALYALFQYPSGRLSDRLSRKTLIVAGTGFLVVGYVALWQSVSYATLLVGVSIAGIGAGLYPTAARALISDFFVTRRGQAFGLHTAAGDVGNAAAAGLAVLAVTVATWHEAFLPLAIFFAVLLVLVHVWSEESYVVERVDLDALVTVRRLLGNRQVRWLLVAYMLFAFSWQSATGFLPSLLQFEKGLSLALASSAFALYFVVGTVTKPAAGLLGDRFSRPLVAVYALFMGIGGLLMILLVQRTPLVFVGICVFSAGMLSWPPLIQAYFMDLFPEESMGGDLGAIRTLYIGFGSLGPTYVGYVAEVQSYTIAFGGLAVCLFLSAGIVLLYERLY